MTNRLKTVLAALVGVALSAAPAAFSVAHAAGLGIGSYGTMSAQMGGAGVGATTSMMMHASLDASTTASAQGQVHSNAELLQTIQAGKSGMAHGNATSSAASAKGQAEAAEHASQVSVAVHALLASRDMLGGIGRQVSQAAQQINDSLATTTAAEARIHARGFFTSLFFGGDAKAADEIQQQVELNQSRIAQITQLLAQSSASADVRATLGTQLQVISQDQARLQVLAKQQKGLWGIFSWRF